MSELLQIKQQIEELQKRALEIKQNESSTVLEEIAQKMNDFGITLEDIAVKIQGTSPSVRRAIAKATGSKSTKPAPAKYTGPNGESWTGRGLAPRWLSALIAQGRTKEEFAIKD